MAFVTGCVSVGYAFAKISARERSGMKKGLFYPLQRS
jgi:hypothetical protein